MKPDDAVKLHVEPITVARANAYVDAVHRHHGPTAGGFASLAFAAADERGIIRGVAIAGFPVAANRLTDGFRTLEVTRVATDGCPNACSVLYGAAARIAKHLGYSRVITYVLDSETGTSLKGAGWTQDDGTFGNQSWADHSKRPGRAVNVGPKGRWSKTFAGTERQPLAIPPNIQELLDGEDVEQLTLADGVEETPAADQPPSVGAMPTLRSTGEAA